MLPTPGQLPLRRAISFRVKILYHLRGRSASQKICSTVIFIPTLYHSRKKE
nr:MAG TPA: hypothetical protein [Caudoviricetes sp.]